MKRTISSINHRARYLGIHNLLRWTKFDEEIFLKFYNNISLDEFCLFFPERSRQAIKSKAHNLGLCKTRKNKIKCIEDNIIFNSIQEITEYYKGISSKTIWNSLKNGINVLGKYHFKYIDDQNYIPIFGKGKHKWSIEEDNYLKNNYASKTSTVIADDLNLTCSQIRNRIKKLNLKKL